MPCGRLPPLGGVPDGGSDDHQRYTPPTPRLTSTTHGLPACARVVRTSAKIAAVQARRPPAVRANVGRGADRDQPSQVIVPVTVPVSVASGNATGVPLMEQVTGPGAVGLDATWVSEPKGEVNVRSTLAGWKIPRAPMSRAVGSSTQRQPVR